MFELKTLSTDAIPAALAQAERYRLLNEPAEAESICLDILRIDPDNQEALVTFVLALTDQFPDGPHARAAAEAEKALARIRDDYKRAYYSGIVRERRGKAVLRSDRPGSGRSAQEWLREAMALLRARRSDPPARQRRSGAALEHLCAHPDGSCRLPAPDVQEFSAIQSE